VTLICQTSVREDPIAPTVGVPPRSSGLWLRLILAAAVIGAILLARPRLGALLPAFAESLDELGPLGPLVFMATYAAATIAFVPGSLLTLAAGALFGVALGTVYALVGATVGSAVAFLISRHVARAAFERRVSEMPRFGAIDKAIARDGWRVAVLLRLSPLIPFNLLNYALGLTGIRFSHFLAASLGMLPGTLLYTYSGKLVGDVAAVAAGYSPPRTPAAYLVLVLGLVATAAVTLLITRRARQALAAATAGTAR
jgi:uncharacterized membrane protein YdjX (TVP38/TMEM64 family)